MTGARSTDQWKEHRALLEAISRNNAHNVHPEVTPPAPAPAPTHAAADPVVMTPRWRELVVAAVLAVVAIVWVAALATSLQPEAAPIAEIARLVSTASGPLALLGIVYLLFLRTSRREARRFVQTSTAMRAEAAGLEHVVGRLADRIEDNRKALAEHAHHLLLLGEDSTLRLAEIATQMRSESVVLAESSDQLERAARTARGDMGALLTDIPRAEAQIEAIAGRLREAELSTQRQAEELEGQLSALVRVSHEADQAAGGAAQRLAQHLTKIEANSEAAGHRIDAAAETMRGAVETALASAADAIDQTRQGLDRQGAAMLAMIEQGAAALDRAAADATGGLDARLSALATRIGSMGGELGRQEATALAMLGSLDSGIAGLESRLAEIDRSGLASADRLGSAVAMLRDHADRLAERFVQGEASAATLASNAAGLHEALTACTGQLSSIESLARAGGAAIQAITPGAAALEGTVRAATDRLAEAEAAIARERAALEGIGDAAEARLVEIRDHAEALEKVIGQAGESARLLVDGAGPALIDALLRIRETAVQAAERARDSLTAAIPSAAAELGAASKAALDKALGDQVSTRINEIADIAEQAVQAAQRASDRLMRQMLTIADTTAAVEARIEEAKQAAAESDEDQFARRVALLIESLNSASIDVAKIFSNDVTDKAWAAYLKGDRSVFTRRAVRLIDAAQAREIMRHYEAEPEFRDQVNRYVHDFEAMLRRVLAARDGAPLGVTLLSSDMGKLYVALAQAIERLRD